MKMHILSLTLLLASAGVALPDVWEVDTAHSSAQFAVRHMMVATVRGTFGDVRGTVIYDPKEPAKSSVQATVAVASIDTREPKRDAHLKSADFFDAENHPTMTFRSTKVEPAGSGMLKVTGDLTIRGVTKPVVFEVEGPMPAVNTGRAIKSGATGTAKIKRSDFGLTWNRVLETGGVVVGDEVTITVDLELDKK